MLQFTMCRRLLVFCDKKFKGQLNSVPFDITGYTLGYYILLSDFNVVYLDFQLDEENFFNCHMLCFG